MTNITYLSKIFYLLTALSFQVLANSSQSTIYIDEDLLSEKFDQIESIQSEIQADFRDSEVSKFEFDNNFSTTVYANGQSTETNEPPLTTFSPVFSPSRTASFGIKKALKRGAEIDFQVGVLDDSFTINSMPSDVTTTYAKLTASIELIKNFLGKTTLSQSEVFDISNARAKIKQGIDKHGLYVELRRIYWDMIALEEARAITNELFEISKKQVADVKKRFKQSIADQTEVAGYESQLLNRKASLVNLEYRRQQIFERLYTLLPEYQHKKLAVAPIDITATTKLVLSCTKYIQNLKDFPAENTSIDEIVDLISKESMAQDKVVKQLDKPSLELYGSLQTIGRDSVLKGSLEDNFDENRTGHSIGLNFTYTFGKNKERRAKREVSRLRYKSQYLKVKNQAEAYHLKVANSFKHLEEIINNQQLTSSVLRKRLKGMQKKYKQARISVNDLIQDQDSLLRSELNVIETKREVLNLLLDYFKIYNDTPCEFNKKV